MHLNKGFILCLLLMISASSFGAFYDGKLGRLTGTIQYSKDGDKKAYSSADLKAKKEQVMDDVFDEDSKRVYSLAFAFLELKRYCKNIGKLQNAGSRFYKVDIELKQLRPKRKAIRKDTLYVQSSNVVSFTHNTKDCDFREIEAKAFDYAVDLWTLSIAKQNGEDTQDDIDDLVAEMKEGPTKGFAGVFSSGIIKGMQAYVDVVDTAIDGAAAIGQFADDHGGSLVGSMSTSGMGSSSDDAMEILRESSRQTAALSNQAIQDLNEQNKKQYEANQQAMLAANRPKQVKVLPYDGPSLEEQREQAIADCKQKGGRYDIAKSTCFIEFRQRALTDIGTNTVSHTSDDQAKSPQSHSGSSVTNGSPNTSGNLATSAEAQNKDAESKNTNRDQSAGNKGQADIQAFEHRIYEALIICWNLAQKGEAWTCHTPTHLQLGTPAKSLASALSAYPCKAQVKSNMSIPSGVPHPSGNSYSDVVHINCNRPLFHHEDDVVSIYNIGGAAAASRKQYQCSKDLVSSDWKSYCKR